VPRETVEMSEERRQRLRAELVKRLGRVRGQMSDAQFAELVSSVERTAVRLAEIDAKPRTWWVGEPTAQDQ
jgi:hypothetical protein